MLEDINDEFLLFSAVDKVSQKLDRVLPDYTLVFAVPILAQLSFYQKYDDLETLKRIQGALLFLMEPLITKNENFSFGFYKALVEKMKCHKDRRNADDEEANMVIIKFECLPLVKDLCNS